MIPFNIEHRESTEWARCSKDKDKTGWRGGVQGWGG